MLNLTIPQPKEAADALAQANRLIRAHQILAEGYTFEFDPVFPQCFVRKPGSRRIAYTVDAVNGGCDCPDMKRTGRPCKHFLAVWLIEEKAREEEEAHDAARLAEYEAQADAEALAEEMYLTGLLHRQGIDY